MTLCLVGKKKIWISRYCAVLRISTLRENFDHCFDLDKTGSRFVLWRHRLRIKEALPAVFCLRLSPQLPRTYHPCYASLGSAMTNRIVPRLYASLPHSIYTLSTYYSRLTPYSLTLMGLNGDHKSNRLVVAALNAEPIHGATIQAIHDDKRSVAAFSSEGNGQNGHACHC
ncbi:hypothetical protein BKA93DRAFT_573473 [Sparassis latifolia]